MKILIPISNEDVAPRLDLAVETVIAELKNGKAPEEPRLLVLSEPSGDEVCALAVRESVDLVICGGIDEVHYEYLAWKKINILDGVIGQYREALETYLDGRLKSNAILPGARRGKQPV